MSDEPEDIDPSEHCEYPQPQTKFSSIEELTLSQEDGLLKLVKRLSNKFQLPNFSEQEIIDSVSLISRNLDYYYDTKWENLPDVFFKVPIRQPLICVSSPHKIKGGEVRDITFKTHFESANPTYGMQFKKLIKPRSVKAKHWMHTTTKPSGCVIAAHGWNLGDEKSSALTMVPGYFYNLGLDVIVVELPMHGSRKSELDSIIQMFPSLDPAVTNENFAQSVCELREIANWARSEINCPIIGVGLSLGAQVIALWASLDNLDAAVCVAPLVSLPTFIWNQVSGTSLETTLVKSGLGKQVLEQGFAVSNPLSYFLSTPRNQVLIVAGRNDIIVPSSHAETLYKHWNSPRIHWLQDGHIEQLTAPSTGLEIKDFLSSLGLIR